MTSRRRGSCLLALALTALALAGCGESTTAPPTLNPTPVFAGSLQPLVAYLLERGIGCTPLGAEVHCINHPETDPDTIAKQPRLTVDITTDNGRVAGIVSHASVTDTDTKVDQIVFGWFGDTLANAPGMPPGLEQWVSQYPHGGAGTVGGASVIFTVTGNRAAMSIGFP